MLMGELKRLVGRVAAVVLLAVALAGGSGVSSVAFAADDAEKVAQGVAEATKEHAEGGLPQLNVGTYPTQLFWLAITFGLLMFLMSKVALPRVAEVLEARQEKIADDLDRAQSLKAEADAVIAAYEKAVADARANARAVLAETVAATDAETAKRQGDLAAELATRAREAEARIQAAKDAALANVRSVSAEAAQAAVARLVGLDVDQARAEAAVDVALKERA